LPKSRFDAFEVFISSNQREFSGLRKDLRDKIDEEPFHDQEIMKGILIEDEYGEVNNEKIAKKIDECAIYVGIFGRDESDWTFAEYRAAKVRDIPILVYYYRKQLRRGRPRAREKRGRPSGVREFLDREVKPFFDIHGYDKPYTSRAQLITDIMDHLAMQAAKMVNEAANVRKTIHMATVLP